MDQAELLERCIAGDRTAWDALVRRHAGMMHAVVCRVLPPAPGDGRNPDAEDVLQAVFLKLWDDGRRRLRTFRGRSRLSTWLVAVARREALDRIRSERVRARRTAEAAEQVLERFASDLREHAPSPQEAALNGVEDARGFAAAVAQLPARDRLLVRLVYEDGCTYREAAALLGARENSIGPWLRRAQERLRGVLEPDG